MAITPVSPTTPSSKLRGEASGCAHGNLPSGSQLLWPVVPKEVVRFEVPQQRGCFLGPAFGLEDFILS